MQVDRASESELQGIANRLISINEVAQIHRTRHCHIDLALILDRHTMNKPNASQELSRFQSTSGMQDESEQRHHADGEHDHASLHANGHDGAHAHKHDERIRTVRLVLEGALDLEMQAILRPFTPPQRDHFDIRRIETDTDMTTPCACVDRTCHVEY